MRRFVVGFLVAFSVVAVTETNIPWPLTGWRLFSSLRGPTQAGWEAVIVEVGDVEVPVPFGSLPRAYRGGLHVLARFSSLSPSERDGVCRAWLDGARDLGIHGFEVHVYRTRSTVSLGGSPPTTVRLRELRYTCG